MLPNETSINNRSNYGLVPAVKNIAIFTLRGLVLGGIWGLILVIYCFINGIENPSGNNSLMSAHGAKLLLVPITALTATGFLLGIISTIYTCLNPTSQLTHQGSHHSNPAETIWHIIYAPFRAFLSYMQIDSSAVDASPNGTNLTSEVDKLLGGRDPANRDYGGSQQTQIEMQPICNITTATPTVIRPVRTFSTSAGTGSTERNTEPQSKESKRCIVM